MKLSNLTNKRIGRGKNMVVWLALVDVTSRWTKKTVTRSIYRPTTGRYWKFMDNNKRTPKGQVEELEAQQFGSYFDREEKK